MPRTSASVLINLTDPTVLAESTIGTTSGLYMATNAGDLLHQKTTPPKYLMEDLNLNALDGTRVAADDSKRPSGVLATATGTSGSASMEVEFTSPHTTTGLALYFAENVPKQVSVTWYDGNDVVSSKTIPVPGDNYFLRNLVENFDRVKIDGMVMRNPDRHARLQFLDYGEKLIYGEDKLISATMYECVDVTSDRLEINTCSLKILDEAGTYDPDNANGEWAALMRGQAAIVTETIDGTEYPCGTFYVEKFSWQEHVLSLELQDAVGLLSAATFYDGDVYNGEQAGNIIRSIMQAAGWDKYTVDTEVARTRVFGHLPICTCREALQAVCFATGATCDDSRSDTIYIGQRNRSISKYIGSDKKFYGATKSSRADFVSGVTVSCKRYIEESGTSELFKGELPQGRSRVQFGSPCVAATGISGGTIVSSGTNYCVVDMGAAGECTITGRKYSAEDFAVEINTGVTAGEKENVKTYDARLYPSNPITIASWLNTYFSWRRELETRIIAHTEQVGDWCGIIDTNGTMTGVLIESQSTDLTGGFLSDISGRGYSDQVGMKYFTGNDDLYMAEDIII